MNKAQELAEKLAVKTRELQDFMGDVSTKDFSQEEQQEIIKRNNELNQIEDERAKAYEMFAVEKKNQERMNFLGRPVDPIGHGDGSRPGAGEFKSIGEQFATAPDFMDKLRQHKGTIDLPHYDPFEGVQAKTLMTTSAGWSAPNPRTNIVIMSAQRRPMVADLIPQDPTTLTSIKYMLETTFTNAAATVAEGGTKPESTLVLTEENAPVVKIAHALSVTEEQLEDVPGAQGYINNRLALMLQLAEETKLLTGTGGASEIDGFLHVSGTQSVAKGTDPTPTAVYKAINDIRAGGSTPAYAEPDGIVIHPNDWVDIATLQDGMGRYIWGNPYDVGPVERLWGKPLIVTPAETENTILVGDFGLYSHISRRMGMSLRIYDQHSDYAAKNQLFIVMEERLSLEIYRPAAFCKVTGV